MTVKEVSPDLLADAGLSEKEIQVYISILGLGNATLGQISQITGIDIFETQELIAQLENLHYVKKLPGILSRYIPMEPFLQGLIDIDKRFQVDMAQLKNALTQNIADFITNLDKTFANLTQIFDLAQDRFNTPQILSKTKEDLNELFSEQKNNYITVKDQGVEILKQSISDLSDKLMKAIGERQGRAGQITHGTIDSTKTAIETSRQTLSSLSVDLSSNLQEAMTDLKSKLFSDLEQHISTHDQLTQSVLQEVDKTVEKYQTEFARSSNYLIDDFKRLVDTQMEKITKNHENLFSSLSAVYENIAKDWTRATNEVKPELDSIVTSLSDFEKRLRAISDEIRDFQPGFRKAFPQEELSAKTTSLASELETLTNVTKNLIDKVNAPIESALAGSQTMTQNTESLISEITNATKEDTNALKNEADAKISGSLRDFKEDLVGENREKLTDYFSNVEKVVNSSKENLDSELTTRIQTQTNLIEQFASKANEQHNNASNSVENDLKRVRTEVESLLAEQGRSIQTLFQEKQAGINSNWNNRVDEFHTKTDKCNSDLILRLSTHFEDQTTALEDVLKEIQAAIDPFLTQGKDIATKVEREVGEKVVAVTMRTAAAEQAISRVQNESTKIRPVITAKTWALLGKQNLPPLIIDMLTRTKSSITLVLPELTGPILKKIAELPQSRKITVVSEIDIDHFERELGQLLDQGNVQLRHYAKKDINMCIRDAEEAFLALESPEEEFVTLLTESEQLVQLLYKIMSSEFVSIAKPVKF